jgi:hypothetical protein
VDVSQLRRHTALLCEVLNSTIKSVQALHEEFRTYQHLVVAATLWRQLVHALRADPLKEPVIIRTNSSWESHAMVVMGLQGVHEVR